MNVKNSKKKEKKYISTDYVTTIATVEGIIIGTVHLSQANHIISFAT